MRVLAIIQAEHRNLGAVLFCLETLLGELERGDRTPDLHLLGSIHDYLEDFLDRFHHPKEDEHLLPAIARRCDGAEAIVNGVRAEHEQGAEMLTNLRVKLSEAGSGGDPLGVYIDAARAYIEFERDHALREERELLPLARECLTSEDWDEVHAAFAEHEDPLFGAAPAERYRRLSNVLMETFLFGRPLL